MKKDAISDDNFGKNECMVNVSVVIPEMRTNYTRGGLSDTPGSDLQLTLLEFEKGSSAATSNLTRVYRAETNTTTAVGNGELVKFSFIINLTDQPRILHLMITDDYISTGYGSEASLLPSLTVGQYGEEPIEAYWGYVEFEEGYAFLNEDGNLVLNEDVTSKLQNVPVIRNFSRVNVSLNNDTGNEIPFVLQGYELINVPMSGTIAPYNASNMSVPNLLDTDGKMKSFSDINSIYTGILPANTYFSNVESEARLWTSINSSDNSVTDGHQWKSGYIYFYERPYNSTLHTYMIIKGIYTGDSNSNQTSSYYKIDLGNIAGENNMFEYYNLIRNFEYNVIINKVSAPGSSTVAGAIDGITYNNLSADVNTNNMLSVSNGEQMLVVNSTSIVFVDSNHPFDLTYKYYTDVATQDYDNSIVKVIGLSNGPVISSYEELDGETADGMKTIRITPNNPTADTKTQSFTIVDGEGLGRTINLVLRTPWAFADENRKIIVQSGSANKPTGNSNTTIGSNTGDDLTVYFCLPSAMPESVFPLQVRLQSLKQDIENNPIGTLVVSYGNSLFPVLGSTDYAISYIKTVTWDEYNFNYYDSDSNGHTVNDINVNSVNTDHMIRCRFRTITSDTGETQMRIANDYFTTATFTFNRE